MANQVGRKEKTSPKSRLNVPLTVLLTAVLALLASLGTSQYLHGNYTFNHANQYTNPNWWLQHLKSPLNLTESQLASFDGRDWSESDRNGIWRRKSPLYLAINGSVYDVSASPELYGPGGSYAFFTGKDGARAYITGCFATDLTHDLRGVPREEWIELRAWRLFYETHPKYFKVGTVHHPPIDPSIPPPAPCESPIPLFFFFLKEPKERLSLARMKSTDMQS